MKPWHAFVIFLILQCLGVFFYVYKRNLFIKTSFAEQHAQAEQTQLKKEKQALEHTLQQMQQYDAIEQFAQQELNMQPITLQQTKKLDISW